MSVASEGRMHGKVLVVDDDPGMCDLLQAGLSRRGFTPVVKRQAAEALATLESGDFDAVVTDLKMPGVGGIELCSRLAAERPDAPVVVITAFGSLETAVQAMRAGAFDFITKPFEIDALAMALERAVQHGELRREVKRLREVVAESQRYGEMLGASPAIKKVWELLDRVAESDASVLISGESGTGKELVARALHHRGRRKSGPFVAVNCSALPEPLLESELFGHARGAFTDAKTSRAGLFLRASGGTLFLDEIGDMPLGLQPKLLRALQDRAVRPVGGDQEVPFDVRIVAATNKDLEELVQQKRFREDLFFRLNVIQVRMPPLRSRGGDVLILAQHFVEQFAARDGKQVAGLSSSAAERLLAYPWPGNVRELQNCIERAVAVTCYDRLAVEDLPDKIREHKSTNVVVASSDPGELVTMDEVERRYILRVLEAAGGNKTLAAQLLGFDRRTLYRKLERYGRRQDPQAPTA